MKNYEEIAENVRVRSEAILAQKKRRRKQIFRALSVITPCLAIVLIGVGIWVSMLLFPTTGELPHEVPPSSEQGDIIINPAPDSYGTVTYLPSDCKTDTAVTGPSQIGSSGSGSSGVSGAPPSFEFVSYSDYTHVVCRAVEEYEGIYETLSSYTGGGRGKYRIYRMEVLNPLDSGMSGTFTYLFPNDLKGDLTQYDALLVSIYQLSKNMILLHEGQLEVFEYTFASNGAPELGKIIAFNDHVFDESLWQDESWIYGYQFAEYMLDENHPDLLVHRGSTLEEALARRREIISLWSLSPYRPEVIKMNPFDIQSQEVKEAMEYLTPFKNGVFIPHPNVIEGRMIYYRYINGCPTNEYIRIHTEDETVATSAYRFEDGDFENLPDIAAYIAGLNLGEIQPQHIDPEGKTMYAPGVKGWYEKTENGVYAIVRISWIFSEKKEKDGLHLTYNYYDETFILLDETGDHVVSREELIQSIGQNVNIYRGRYGFAEPQPM